MPGARLTLHGQGTKVAIDILDLVNITDFLITDIRVLYTNTEPKRLLVFEFDIDAIPYRMTFEFTDETYHARDLKGRLKVSHQALESKKEDRL